VPAADAKTSHSVDEMKYCSHCGNRVEWIVPTGDDRPRHVCRRCETVFYKNPVMVVGCIPVWDDKILMCRRAIEPQRGLWTLPAGFLEIGETVAEGAARETREETGAAVIDLRPYLLFDIVHIQQMYFMFRSRLQKPDFNTTRESAEVKLFSQEEVPWGEIAFRVIDKTLQLYFKNKRTGQFDFQIYRIEAPDTQGR